MEDREDEDFAALFAASERATRFETGQPVEGTIVALGADVAFVDVGAKSEATIALAELRDEDGALEVAVGDRLQATVMSTAGGLTLSRKLQRRAATARQLEGAFRAGLPVEGKVEGQVKGGYSVTIARQRAFCPQSQIDIVRDTDPQAHEGRVYTFRILEYADEGRKFVVSRRVLLEEEQKARAEDVRRALAVGAVVTGRVVSVRDFGVFVDLGGGVQALLPVSEMGWSRVANPAEVAAQGQEITAAVLRMDDATRQITLSSKPLLADPWSRVPAAYGIGQVREGRVTRIAEFGAFVELEPGIEGLAHASTFPPAGRAGGWSKSVHVGMTGAFEILAIDLDRKRISLSPVDDASPRALAARTAREEPTAGAPGPNVPPQPFGDSLAEKLRGALKK